MKRLTFYEYIMNAEEGLLSETVLRNAIKEIPTFPKANCDKKTVESALRRFMGEKYNPCALDLAWENYRSAIQKEKIMDFLTNG